MSSSKAFCPNQLLSSLETNMHNFGEEPDWEPLDLDGALWASAALLGVLLVHLLIRLCSGFTDRLIWLKAWTQTRLVHLFFSVVPEGTGNDSRLDIERRLGKIEHTLYDIKEFMECLQTEFRDIKATAVEAIELPNNVCEVLVDIEGTMKTLAPKLERLVGVVKHRIDNQNSVLQCMYYSLDEQFLLLCDLANILEEAIDPTSPYPFTLRLAHRPRGQGARPRNRQYY